MGSSKNEKKSIFTSIRSSVQDKKIQNIDGNISFDDVTIIKLLTDTNESQEGIYPITMKINQYLYEIKFCGKIKGASASVINRFVKINHDLLDCYIYTQYFNNYEILQILKKAKNFLEQSLQISFDKSSLTKPYESYLKDFGLLQEFHLTFSFSNKKYNLSKIFYTFLNVSKEIKQSKNFVVSHLSSFEEFFILDKDNHRISYENKTQTEEIPFNIGEHLYDIKVKTKKLVSVFHDDITIITNENKNCLFMFQYLSEDTYVEKNEFISMTSSINSNKEVLEYAFSSFIDQELSSDLTSPYYTAINLCQNNNISSLKYPIHIRYQPPSNTADHNRVIMPMPYIHFYNLNKTSNITQVIAERLFREQTITGSRSKYIMNIEEITSRLDDLNYLLSYRTNHNELAHYIPVGRLNDFYKVAIITLLVTCFGSSLILYQLLMSTLKKVEQNVKQVKQE